MGTWTPQDWILFLTALGGFATTLGGVIVTIVLQMRGNAKTDAAKVISADNNDKLTAVVHQTNNIAAAVPGATTDATDAVIARNNGA